MFIQRLAGLQQQVATLDVAEVQAGDTLDAALRRVRIRGFLDWKSISIKPHIVREILIQRKAAPSIRVTGKMTSAQRPL